MAALTQNSPDVLCAEILAEARRESEEITRHAKAEVEALRAGASTEAEKIRRETQEQAQAEATRRRELILATVAIETGRLRAARIETLLESVREEIRRRLQARDFDWRSSAIALAVEAVRMMPGREFTLQISAADQAAVGNDLTGEIERHVGRSPLNLTIFLDAKTNDGGVMIQSADGFQCWDNRLSSRLERLWPELRRQIAIRASLVGDNRCCDAPSQNVSATLPSREGEICSPGPPFTSGDEASPSPSATGASQPRGGGL